MNRPAGASFAPAGRRFAALCLVASLVAACAAGSGASGAPTGEVPSLPIELPSGKPLQPPVSSAEIEITGVVEGGVESGCRVLRTETTLYQLISADPLIVEGASLVVRGRPRPDLVTTCQQGIPFQVAEVRAQ